MTAYPMLLRCAAHQLREDDAMYAHLLTRQRDAQVPRPNLLVVTGPERPRTRDDEHGVWLPMLCLKAG